MSENSVELLEKNIKHSSSLKTIVSSYIDPVTESLLASINDESVKMEVKINDMKRDLNNDSKSKAKVKTKKQKIANSSPEISADESDATSCSDDNKKKIHNPHPSTNKNEMYNMLSMIPPQHQQQDYHHQQQDYHHQQQDYHHQQHNNNNNMRIINNNNNIPYNNNPSFYQFSNNNKTPMNIPPYHNNNPMNINNNIPYHNNTSTTTSSSSYQDNYGRPPQFVFGSDNQRLNYYNNSTNNTNELKKKSKKKRN
jgi:E3 ubiquitin-protein ligase HUWE1